MVQTRLTRAKKSSKIGTGVVKARAPSEHKKSSRNLKSGQHGHRHRSIEGHRECCPEDFPDLDLHQSYGSFLTRKNPISQNVDPDVASDWAMLSTNPAMLQHRVPDITDRYRTAFKRFFNIDPISIHGHVSDAANPFVLTSLLMHLTAYSSKDCGVFFLSEEDRVTCRIAVTDRSYGAGCGPLAHHSIVPICRQLACGATPFVVDTRVPTRIDKLVRRAKEEGCVALIAEIVRAADGTVISEAGWKALLQSCREYCLVLVVDEAMTAIRCGAPFAHQLPQYKKAGLPDLVLFGKGVRINGIAIEWQGINIQKLAIMDEDMRLFVILSWQERYTEAATAADILTSTGILTLAAKEDWPQRAQKIGHALRDIIGSKGFAKPSAIGGLHGLIYMRQQDYRRSSSPVMGAYAGKYIRWLPVMDEVMTSKDELQAKMFGKGSLEHRKEISQWFDSKKIQPRWCSICGEGAGDEKGTLCPTCVVRQCENCEPGQHQCPM